jgi:hypothetical protein
MGVLTSSEISTGFKNHETLTTINAKEQEGNDYCVTEDGMFTFIPFSNKEKRINLREGDTVVIDTVIFDGKNYRGICTYDQCNIVIYQGEEGMLTGSGVEAFSGRLLHPYLMKEKAGCLCPKYNHIDFILGNDIKTRSQLIKESEEYTNFSFFNQIVCRLKFFPTFNVAFNYIMKTVPNNINLIIAELVSHTFMDNLFSAYHGLDDAVKECHNPSYTCYQDECATGLIEVLVFKYRDLFGLYFDADNKNWIVDTTATFYNGTKTNEFLNKLHNQKED